MTRWSSDSEKTRREIRTLAESIYDSFKKKCKHDPELCEASTEDFSCVSEDLDVAKLFEADDRLNLLEKLQVLAIELCRERESVTLLRFENEHLKDRLEDLHDELRWLKSRDASRREELSYLRVMTKNQKAANQRLQAALTTQQDTSGTEMQLLKSNAYQGNGPDLPSDTATSEPETTTSTSWMQSIQNAFRKAKRSFMMDDEAS